MKKIISVLMSLILVVSTLSTAYAQEGTAETVDATFSYYNDRGEIVTVSTSRSNTSATANVYLNGTLIQKSIANAMEKTIETEIYDLQGTNRSVKQAPVVGKMGDFDTTVIHRPVSVEKINTVTPSIQTRVLKQEPVDNTGISPSIYNDGTYFLGTYGGLYYAPNVYGYLFRGYTETYDGETKYWNWDAGDTVSAISAYIALFGGPASAIIGILVFAAGEILAYNQSVELATHTFDYWYVVRVYGTIYFTTQRNVTYWRIDNVTTGTTKWEQKRFNYGFSMSNEELVTVGINNYIQTQQ